MVPEKKIPYPIKPRFVQRIYQVPATHILPRPAAKEYQKLLVPNREFSANHIARKIARITKETINYNFKDNLCL